MKNFFGQGGDESLTWEAKGGEITAHHVRVAASAFGNSQLGGNLVLGISRTGGPWVPDRWTPPGGEVRLWLETCLANGGVDPKPSIEVKSFDLDGDGTV